MADSRTKNASRNLVSGLTNRLIKTFLPFISRTIIIYQLGAVYLGIGTLFTSVLSFLNLAELGFSSAVTYAMYKPIADNDISAINALLKYYRKIYSIVGIAVLIIGTILVPALPYIIKGSLPEELNLYVLYYIYLVDSVISYFFAGYRQSILSAYQRTDITNKISMGISFFNNLGQIVVLLLTKNYYVYALVPIVGTLFTNVLNAIITRKKYPLIHCDGEVPNEIKNDIKKKLGGLFGTKLNSIVVHQADIVVISAFIGVIAVSEYGNYYYIMSAIVGILNIVFNSMTASVGNKIATDSIENVYILFKKIRFMNSWMVSWCSICLVCIYQPFMKIWVGETYMFDMYFVLLFVMYFFIYEIQRTVLTFKDAAGLWYQDRFRPYVSMTLNLVSNIVLVHFIGIYGIVFSTILAFIVSLPWANYVLYSKLFNKSCMENIWYIVRVMLITVIVGIITFLICSLFNEGIIGLIEKIVVCCLVPNIIFIFIFRKNPEFEFYIGLIKHRLFGRNNKNEQY